MNNTRPPILVFRPSQLVDHDSLAVALEAGLLEQSVGLRQAEALTAALLATGQRDSELAGMLDFFVLADSAGRRRLMATLAGLVREEQHRGVVSAALGFMRRYSGVDRFGNPAEVKAEIARELKNRRTTPIVFNDGAVTPPVQQKWEIADFDLSVDEMTRMVNPIVRTTLRGEIYEITIRFLDHKGVYNVIEVRVNGVIVGNVQLVYRDGFSIRLERLKTLRSFRSGPLRLSKEEIIEGLRTWEVAYNQRVTRRQLLDLYEREKRGVFQQEN